MRVTVVDAAQPIDTVEEVCDHHLLVQRLGRPNSNQRFPRPQRLKALRPPILSPPSLLFLDIIEQRNNVPQATAHPILSARDPAQSNPITTKQGPYFCTSTLPNVRLSNRTSNSSAFAEKASSMASTSSTPWSRLAGGDRLSEEAVPTHRVCVYDDAIRSHTAYKMWTIFGEDESRWLWSQESRGYL
jgi:hypothetical protein